MPDSTDEADLSAVPLFPLPNVVLFPSAVLPLHIFEERYKIMTADAVRGSRLIAMALLGSGWEKNYHGSPAVDPVVCVGEILSSERLADGCYNFLLQGITRARIVREICSRPYRIAELKQLEEQPAMEIDLTEERRRLKTAFETNCLLRTGIGQQFRQLLTSSLPTAIIADLVAFNFLEDVSLKQSLLSDCDVRQRVTRTVDAFELAHAAVCETSPMTFCENPSWN